MSTICPSNSPKYAIGQRVTMISPRHYGTVIDRKYVISTFAGISSGEWYYTIEYKEPSNCTVGSREEWVFPYEPYKSCCSCSECGKMQGRLS